MYKKNLYSFFLLYMRLKYILKVYILSHYETHAVRNILTTLILSKSTHKDISINLHFY